MSFGKGIGMLSERALLVLAFVLMLVGAGIIFPFLVVYRALEALLETED